MPGRADLFEQCREWYRHHEYERVLSTAEAVLAADALPPRDRSLWLSLKAAALSTRSPLGVRPAIGCLQEALEHARGDLDLRARLLAELSATYAEGGDPKLVRPVLPRYLRIERQLGGSAVLRWGARIYYNLGTCLAESQQFREAERSLRRAANRWRRYLAGGGEAAETQWLGLTLHNLAGVLVALGRCPEAEQVMDEGHPLLPSDRFAAKKLNRRAELALATGDPRRAAELTAQALADGSLEGDDHTRADILLVSARALSDLGRREEALDLARQVYMLAASVHYGPMMSRAQAFIHHFDQGAEVSS